MLWFYEAFFPVLWIAFLLYWQIKAANTKATQRLEPIASRILRVFIFTVAIALLSTTRIPLPWLYSHLWPAGLWPFWLGAAITVAGLLFAIWARAHLGRNWSRSVTSSTATSRSGPVLTPWPATPSTPGFLSDSLAWQLQSLKCAGSSLLVSYSWH
jgi:hypothetical protein